jgi:glycogen operon protein
MGRHRLTLDDDPATACHLTVAPARCFLPDALAAGQRRFGVAAHLYTLRGSHDQGIGDFSTLAELGSAAARAGAAVVGLNPLHALFPGDRSRASPYHPSHRGFLDPIYIDIAGLPGADPGQFAALSAPAMVDYPAVWAVKHRALRAAFAAGGADDPALDAFIAAGGAPLRDFARFEAIAAHRASTQWRTWPDALRHPASSCVAAFAARHASAIRFVCYMQMLADRQLGDAAARSRAAGLSIGLYRDLAVGCAPDGAEAWAYQDMLLDGVSVGAPPDPFTAAGQVWGLPPPDPLAMARDGFAGFAALIAANLRHAGALRIDHVLGLRRLFLVPEGARGSDGTYLDFPFHHLLGQLTLASVRASCLIVGEDLGTVPDGIRERLNDAQVLSYRVLWFERDGPNFRPPATWPALAAACVSTHDLPTSRGWWQGADIAEQRHLGFLDDGTEETARQARQAEKAALIAFARAEGVADDLAGPEAPDPPDLAMHALIAATPCVLALVQADDLASEAIGVNLPGTDRERPNWRRRLRLPVAALFDGADRSPALLAMRSAGRAAGSALDEAPIVDASTARTTEP